MIKKALSLVFCAVIIFGASFIPASAASTKLTCRTADEMMTFVIVEDAFTVPIRIVPAKLKQNGKTRNVYLVALMGVKTNNNQVNCIKNLVPVAFDKDNPYYDLVKEVVTENIPKNSKIVFAGHSMGGMVAQQLRADADLKKNYEIVATVTAGSPLILIDDEGEGQLNRLVDKYDAIPFMSPATVVALKDQVNTAHRENGGYFFKPGKAHTVSYMSSDEWSDYDVLGVLSGNASISFDTKKVTEYGVVPED